MYSDNSAEEFLEFFPLLELPLEPVSRRQREITPLLHAQRSCLYSQNHRISGLEKILRDQLGSNSYIIHQIFELLQTQSFQALCH